MARGTSAAAAACAALSEAAAVAALLRLPGLGPVRVRALRATAQRQGLPLPAFCAQAPAALARALDPATAHTLTAHRVPWAAEARLLRQAEGRSVCCLLDTDSGYPAALKRALGAAAPPLLYAQGNLALLSQAAAAVVGTRRPSRSGIAAARACASHIAGLGPLVSGGAAGIDTAAHEAALKAGGCTIVVVPQGLLTYAPSRRLGLALAGGTVLFLSETPLDAPWQTHQAVARNRLIGALARLVCVIEPSRTGGSASTARHALGWGRPVLLLPAARSPFTAPLLHAGAQPLEAGDDRGLRAQLTAAWAGASTQPVSQALLFG